MFNERPIVQNLIGLLDWLVDLVESTFSKAVLGVYRNVVRMKLVTSVKSGYRKTSE